MSFKPYSDYRARTNRYLPSVPSHWEATRFKLFAEEREERSTDGNELLLSVSEYSGVSPRSTIVDEGDHLSRAESLEGYKVCHPGDLVMNIMLAWKKAQGVSDYHGIVSPAYSVYALRGKANPRFIHYLARTQIYADYFKSFSSGVIDSRLRLYPDTFLGLKTDLPPEEEQSSIASFLDRETSKIDALIAEQQRLIELLQEKRQSVISHAVTKGLNPNAPMKDSGVEWLGEVPEHWEVKPLKHLTRQISVGVVVEPSKYYDDQGTVPALRSLNIKAGEIQMDDCVYITEESNEILKKSRLCAGDLVVVRTGQPGTCAVIPDELDNCNCIDLIFIRKPRDGDSTYLMLSLSSDSSRYQYAAGAEGAIQQHFNVKTASELVVPWPPEEEQSQIRDWLMRKTSDVDRLTSIAVQSIELLEERRSALISAAVTGQMDVRGLVEEEAVEQ